MRERKTPPGEFRKVRDRNRRRQRVLDALRSIPDEGVWVTLRWAPAQYGFGTIRAGTLFRCRIVPHERDHHEAAVCSAGRVVLSDVVRSFSDEQPSAVQDHEGHSRSVGKNVRVLGYVAEKHPVVLA